MKTPQSVLLPLSADDDRWAILTATWPVSEESWALMLKILEIMKPGLVATPAETAAEPGGAEEETA